MSLCLKMLDKPLQGILCFIFLSLSSFLGTIFIHGPAMALLLFRPSWFSRFNDFAIKSWIHLPAALLEFVLGVKVVLTGDRPRKEDRALIIMNHRCRLDWMFYWSIVARYGHLGHEKIILKNELKHIPGLGWAMQNALYIFLKRSWEQDEEYFTDVLEYFSRGNRPLQLLLFPEGTNLEEITIHRSHAFAEKNGLPHFERVLHPRVRGFTFCMNKLRQGTLDAVHDVTVGYSPDKCFGEVDFILGRLPEEVHFHVQRCPNESLPTDEEALAEWCRGHWEQKEARLTEFHNGRYRMTSIEESNLLCSSNNASIVKSMKFALVAWSGFVLLAFFLLFYSRFVRWYFVIQVIFFFVQSTFNGGLDKLQLAAHKHFGVKKD